ncbi:SPOR domain-containing protein [Candidatus Cloacimonadota bacterium]
MKNLIILVIITLFFTTVHAEDPDAEKAYFYLKEDTGKQVDKSDYENIFMENPESFYGQSALLDLAKIELLQRNYDQALKYFKKIYHPDITTKEFWMAKCYLLKGEPDSAIISAQNYIYTSFDNNKIETSYFTIAEAYIDKGLFQKALNTLEYLRNSENINNNIPLLHYKMGFCNEKLGAYEKALSHYKKLKLDFPYHEYTYLAEDRIYEMKTENKIDIDLKEILINETETDPVIEDNSVQNEKGSYLQVGAFSKEANAVKQAEEIKKKYSGNYIVFEKNSNGNTLYVAAFGPYSNKEKLKSAKQILADLGYNSFEINK